MSERSPKWSCAFSVNAFYGSKVVQLWCSERI